MLGTICILSVEFMLRLSHKPHEHGGCALNALRKLLMKCQGGKQGISFSVKNQYFHQVQREQTL